MKKVETFEDRSVTYRYCTDKKNMWYKEEQERREMLNDAIDKINEIVEWINRREKATYEVKQ